MPTNFESESTPPLTPHNELSRIARWQVSEQEFSEASKTSTINLLREFRVEIFRTVALIMIAVAYARPLTTQPRMGILYLLFIVLGAAYYCFLRIEEFRQEGASRRLQDRLIAFADMPIDRGTWLVHLRIHQGETVTGQDFGMMWRDRDFIHFSGLHTSFSLAHSDLSPAASLRIKACKGIRDFRGDVTIPLAMRDVEISVAFGGTAKSSALEGWMKSALLSFIAKPTNTLGGQLPPLERGPGAYTSRTALLPILRTIRPALILLGINFLIAISYWQATVPFNWLSMLFVVAGVIGCINAYLRIKIWLHLL